MASSLVVQFDGDPSKLEKAFSKLELRVKDLQAQLKAAGKASKESEAEIEAAQLKATKAVWEQERAIRKQKEAWELDAKAAEGVNKKVWEQQRAARQLKNEWEQEARAKEKSFNLSDVTKYAVGAVAGYATISAAIAQINRELERKRELEREAAEANITQAQAESLVRENLVNPQDADKVMEIAKAVSDKTKTPLQHVTRGAASILSAGGTIEELPSVLETAARMRWATPQDIGTYAGSMMDLSRVTGQQDARANLGLLAYVAANSRMQDPKESSENIAKALIGMKPFGVTMNDSAAVFGALTQAGGDTQGRRTATASIALASQLDEFFRTPRAAGFTGGLDEGETLRREANMTAYQKARARQAAGMRLTDKDIAAISTEEDLSAKAATRRAVEAIPAGLDTLEKRIAYLWQNKTLAQEFLGREGFKDGASFEKATLGPITDLLLNQNSEAARLYKKNLSTAPRPDRLISEGEARLGLQEGRYREVADIRRTGEATVESIQFSDMGKGQARIGELREQTKKVLRAAGRLDMAERFAALEFDAKAWSGQNPYDVTANQLGTYSAELRAPKVAGITGYSRFSAPQMRMVPASAGDIDLANKLDQMIVELRKLNGGKPALAHPDVDK